MPNSDDDINEEALAHAKQGDHVDLIRLLRHRFHVPLSPEARGFDDIGGRKGRERVAPQSFTKIGIKARTLYPHFSCTALKA